MRIFPLLACDRAFDTPGTHTHTAQRMMFLSINRTTNQTWKKIAKCCRLLTAHRGSVSAFARAHLRITCIINGKKFPLLENVLLIYNFHNLFSFHLISFHFSRSPIGIRFSAKQKKKKKTATTFSNACLLPASLQPIDSFTCCHFLIFKSIQFVCRECPLRLEAIESTARFRRAESDLNTFYRILSKFCANTSVSENNKNDTIQRNVHQLDTLYFYGADQTTDSAEWSVGRQEKQKRIDGFEFY